MPNETPSTRQDPNIPGRSQENENPTRQGVTEQQRELEKEVEPHRKHPDAEITES